MSQTVNTIRIGKREIILVGTAHISKASVEEVENTIRTEKPDRVCVELDATRYKTIKEKSSWKNMDISKVLKEKKGFLLFANVILASFQRRLGLDIGTLPGQEMIKALEVAEELGIEFDFCDREVQVTLRRAWSKSSLWGKNKMIAALLSALVTDEKLSEEEMEKLKGTSLMHNMLEELSAFLPSVKEVLIDERDRYLATKIFNAQGKKIVAVVGAGHVPGIINYIHMLEKKEMTNDVSELEKIPPKGILSRIIPLIIPVVIIGFLVLGLILKGPETSLNGIIVWVLANGISSAAGALLALGHPFAVITAFFAAPVTSLIPVIGAGMVSGLVQYYVRKPRVMDFESVQVDLLKLRGFYKNRILRILLVFMLSGLGSTVGTLIGIPVLIGTIFK